MRAGPGAWCAVRTQGMHKRAEGGQRLVSANPLVVISLQLVAGARNHLPANRGLEFRFRVTV
jgi:hypothetical protein